MFKQPPCGIIATDYEKYENAGMEAAWEPKACRESGEEMHKIQFLPEDIYVEVEDGEDLLTAQIKAGLSPDAPCGGRGTCGKCLADILHEDGSRETVLSCQYAVTKDFVVWQADTTASRILESGVGRKIDIAPQVKEGYGASFDVGTTTVVCYLLDLVTGEEVARASMQNPQRQFGADVISRCEYAMNNGVELLSKTIREGMNTLIEEVCEKTKGGKTEVCPKDIRLVSMVGNTCMHHLFMNISPDSLATAPYEPTVKDEIVMLAKEADIHINPEGILQVLPNIAGFVGADTVGCMLAVEFDKLEELSLMIDIGTNGEMVMGNKERMIVCSAAAGPAFEGARLECGMRGAPGAIDHVRMEGDEIICHVIDEEDSDKAIGICGSGLLDAVACALDAGIVDATGRIDTENSHVFKLPETDMAAIKLTEKVYISQKDIQEAQLAKGAIAAGIELLAEELGISISDIKTVMIAGAFGNYMDPHSACRIGMIPSELEEKISMIGNAAGAGSVIATLNYDEFLRAQKIREKAGFIELASSPSFQETFVDNLMFE